MIPGKVSNVIKCPTNCPDHDYDFPHSIIQHRREYVKDGTRYEQISTFIVCRGCSHWISGNYACRCRFRCHEEEGGTDVATRALDAVN
jgi:hypothetical protein